MSQAENPAASAEETEKKGLRGYVNEIFERPCFRTSFFYGTCSGVGGCLLTFLFTSRSRIATHAGMGIFCTVTLVYFCQCRNRLERGKLQTEELRKKLAPLGKMAPREPSSTEKPEFVKV